MSTTVDIVKISSPIKKHLKDRFAELNLSYDKIVKDAKDRGFSLSKSCLSVYFNNEDLKKNYPTQKQIIWLCLRYGIDIKLNVKKLEYNETECLQRLKEYF
jgi:hypothetical protein